MGAITGQTNFTKPFKWLILALVLKLILYFFFIFQDSGQYAQREFSGPFIRSSDHSEYITPIDNFIETGIYSLENSKESYAGRLPGFVFPYMLFRAIFNESTSNILLGVFILALAILASYVLSLLLFELTKKRWAFVIGFLLMNFAPFFWHYDWTLHPNSLAVSCLIFFTFFFYRYTLNSSAKNLILSGFFLAWLVLLRGFCLVYIPVSVLFLIYLLFKKKNSLKQIAIACILFLMPVSIFESAWITRNYISLHKIIPLQSSFVPGSDSKNAEYGYRSTVKYSLTKVRELVFAWGGENVWYFPDSDFAWFSWKGGKYAEHKFDGSIFYESFTMDTLNLLKQDIIYSYKDSLSEKQHDSIENKIVQTSIHLKEKFKANKKIYYYLYAPVKRFGHYLLRNVTQDWPGPGFNEATILQKIIKLISLLCYSILLLQILIFPVLHFKRRSPDPMINFFYGLLLVSIIPFLFVIAMAHFSYFIFGYILLIPLLVYCITAFQNRRN